MDDLNAIVRINISNHDYLPKVDKSLKDLSRKMQLKGFRQGKVPVGVVRKMHGDAVLADELNRILQEEMNKFLSEEKIEILGSPIPKTDETKQKLDVKQPNDYEFVFEIGLAPIFDVGFLDSKTTVIRYDIEVPENVVDDEIENIRLKAGEVEEVNEIEYKDVVTFKLFELDENGEVKEGGIEHEAVLSLDQFKDEKVAEKIEGMALNATHDLNVKTAFGDNTHHVAHHVLDIKDEELEQVNDMFRIEPVSIKRTVKADLNQDLYDKVYGKDVVTTAEEFRTRMEEETKKYFDQQSDNRLDRDIMDQLLEATEISLPDEFLKRWILETNEKPVTPEQVEEEYEQVAKSIRWDLLVSKVSKDAELEVSNDDIEEETKKSILSYIGQGAQYFDQQQLRAWSLNLMKDENHVKQTYERVMSSKLFKHIKETVTIADQSIALDEFSKLNQQT